MVVNRKKSLILFRSLLVKITTQHFDKFYTT
jgi:hypothetical protein